MGRQKRKKKTPCLLYHVINAFIFTYTVWFLICYERPILNAPIMPSHAGYLTYSVFYVESLGVSYKFWG